MQSFFHVAYSGLYYTVGATDGKLHITSIYSSLQSKIPGKVLHTDEAAFRDTTCQTCFPLPSALMDGGWKSNQLIKWGLVHSTVVYIQSQQFEVSQ